MEKFLSRLVKGFFALLGFATSCTPGSVPEPMYGPIGPAEYGTPSATFRFLGKVSDENEKGILGIRVAVKMSKPWNGAYVEKNGKMVPYVWEQADTLFTDEDGKFAREYTLLDDIASVPEDVVVTAEDVDGEENGGAFTARKDIKVEVKQVDKGDGRWNMGTYESQADIKLEKE